MATQIQRYYGGSARNLVDGLNFPGVVDSFLKDGWKSWNEENVVDSTEGEVETWRALHQGIIREYGPRVPLNTYLRSLDMSSKASPASARRDPMYNGASCERAAV